MKTTTLPRSVLINAPKDKVWKALADFGNVMNLSTNVTKSYLTSEKKTGVGTMRHCDLSRMGAQLEERIVDWKERESMTIDIFEKKNLATFDNNGNP